MGRPDGATGKGALSGSPQATPQRHPLLWSMSPTFDPSFSSTPQQQQGVHAALPGSVGLGQSASAILQGLIGPRIALAPLSLPKFSGDRRSCWRCYLWVLEDCYGDMSQIADNIILELQDLPAVCNNQPREALQLILVVERALLDLIDLGCQDAVKTSW